MNTVFRRKCHFVYPLEFLVTFLDDFAAVVALSDKMLTGFFVGWPTPPSPKVLSKLIRNSTYSIVAIDEAQDRCVGYVTALSDGILFGYVSSLEVLPEFQGQGIGQELVARMLKKLSNVYSVDIVCDPDVQPFYEKCGLRRCASMVTRNPAQIAKLNSGLD